MHDTNIRYAKIGFAKIDLRALKERLEFLRHALQGNIGLGYESRRHICTIQTYDMQKWVWPKKPVAHKNEARKQRDDPKWAVPKRPMAHKNERT